MENLKLFIFLRMRRKIPHIDEYERMNIKIIKKYLGDLSKEIISLVDVRFCRDIKNN